MKKDEDYDKESKKSRKKKEKKKNVEKLQKLIHREDELPPEESVVSTSSIKSRGRRGPFYATDSESKQINRDFGACIVKPHSEAIMKHSEIIETEEDYKAILEGIDWWPVMYDKKLVNQCRENGEDVPLD